MYEVIDTQDGSKVVATLPTQRRATNWCKRREPGKYNPMRGWRYLVRKQQSTQK